MEHEKILASKWRDGFADHVCILQDSVGVRTEIMLARRYVGDKLHRFTNVSVRQVIGRQVRTPQAGGQPIACHKIAWYHWRSALVAVANTRK